jgi:hypothetical protein
MRFLIKIVPCTEASGKLNKAGKLASTMQGILSEQKPEIAYFVPENGKRTLYIVVSFTDASEMPRIAEPWFNAFNAEVHFYPAMTTMDLENARPDIDTAVQKWAQK